MNAIFDLAIDQPLLDSNRHCGLLDERGTVISHAFGHALLHGSAGDLAHMRSRVGVAAQYWDLIDPLDASASIPAGNNEANWGAVVFGQRRAIHRGGEKSFGGLEFVDREDPTCARL